MRGAIAPLTKRQWCIHTVSLEKPPARRNFPCLNRNPFSSTTTQAATPKPSGLRECFGTDPDLIHEPSVGVVGTKGDSQCYMGVMARSMRSTPASRSRVGKGAGQLKLRLVQPEYTIATSDGIRTAPAKCAIR